MVQCNILLSTTGSASVLHAASQVTALLDRSHGEVPVVSHLADALETLGYKSWAHRVICSAGKSESRGCKTTLSQWQVHACRVQL